MARLGELERAVMEVLWGAAAPGEPGLTGREVLTALATRDPAYTTVTTVLDRLVGKDLVRRERDGQAWRYRPAAAREAYIAQLMLEALDLAEPGADGGAAGDRAAGGRGADGSAAGERRNAALVRFARSVTGDDAQRLREALAEPADRPAASPADRRRPRTRPET